MSVTLALAGRLWHKGLCVGVLSSPAVSRMSVTLALAGRLWHKGLCVGVLSSLCPVCQLHWL